MPPPTSVAPIFHQTPRGTLVNPKLNVPVTKYKAEGEYKAGFRIPVSIFLSSGLKAVLDDATADAFRNATADGRALTPLQRAKMKAGGPLYPYGPARDQERNELPDMIDLMFAIRAVGTDPITGDLVSNRPEQFDAQTNPIEIQLIHGIEAIIGFTIFPWATSAIGYGASLRPKAIQVLKLPERSKADAVRYGFKPQDGDALFGAG